MILPVVATARIVSVGASTLLLVALGVGRARVAHRNTATTVLETLAIGAAAGFAGVFIGKLLGG